MWHKNWRMWHDKGACGTTRAQSAPSASIHVPANRIVLRARSSRQGSNGVTVGAPTRTTFINPHVESSSTADSSTRNSASGDSRMTLALQGGACPAPLCQHKASSGRELNPAALFIGTYHSYGVIGDSRSKNGASATNSVRAPSLKNRSSTGGCLHDDMTRGLNAVLNLQKTMFPF